MERGAHTNLHSKDRGQPVLMERLCSAHRDSETGRGLQVTTLLIPTQDATRPDLRTLKPAAQLRRDVAIKWISPCYTDDGWLVGKAGLYISRIS